MSVPAIKILYLEDDEQMAMMVEDGLEHHGFKVAHYFDAINAMNGFINDKPDIVVLDIMVGDVDGFELALQIRSADPIVPIIFVTAKTGINDIVKAFDIGAKDYLKKPFAVRELVIRINMQLKNLESIPKDSAILGAYHIDFNTQKLTSQKETVRLSFRESGLLQKLFVKKNQFVTRKELLKEYWDGENQYTSRSLDVFISKLRSRFKDDEDIEIISIRNIGYQLKVK